jgi:hypothetical protein
VSWASAPIEISAGRARIGKLVTPPQASELAAAGSLDLVDQTLDASITLLGTASGVGGQQRPEVSVSLKGPLAAPKRTIDVGPLVSWLTMQAVDREAKRLEAEELEAKRRQAIIDAMPKPEPAPQAVVPQTGDQASTHRDANPASTAPASPAATIEGSTIEGSTIEGTRLEGSAVERPAPEGSAPSRPSARRTPPAVPVERRMPPPPRAAVNAAPLPLVPPQVR